MYVKNNSNSYTMVIEFEADGEMKTRSIAPWQSGTRSSGGGLITWMK